MKFYRFFYLDNLKNLHKPIRKTKTNAKIDESGNTQRKEI